MKSLMNRGCGNDDCLACILTCESDISGVLVLYPVNKRLRVFFQHLDPEINDTIQQGHVCRAKT
jgi:hypothetical protein